MENYSISVVIITRNEERKIEKCIKSVIFALQGLNDFEIILVDSASTDSTVETAKKYPIRIIQLPSQWPLSAAAGEYTGFKYANGDLICFIGGDMILNPNWFKGAIPYMRDKSLAGISGQINNVINTSRCSKLLTKRIERTSKINYKSGYTQALFGPAMFRKSTLDKVGCYHPFLKAGEESELSQRIITRGYKLLRLSIPIVEHEMDCLSLFTYLMKYQWQYVKSDGSSIRYSYRTNKRIFYKYLPIVLKSMFLNLILLFLILFPIINNSKILYITTGLYFFLFLAALIRRNDVKDALLSIIIIHIRAIALLKGIMHDLPNPEDYPSHPIIIK